MLPFLEDRKVALRHGPDGENTAPHYKYTADQRKSILEFGLGVESGNGTGNRE